MKKFMLGLLCGIGLAISTAAAASDEVRAVLFPVTFEFDGKAQELDARYQVLNYEGNTYVPIRFVAENLGAGASYDPQARKVSIVKQPETTDESKLTCWLVKYRLERGMESKDVKRWFGDPSFVTRIEPASQQVWRYDVGAKQGYQHGGLSTDTEGLKKGDLAAQLFLTWNASGQLERYDLWYMAEQNGEKRIFSYIVYPDGSTGGVLQD